MLGWEIVNEKKDYNLSIPPISKQEEEIINELTKLFKEESKDKDISSKNIRKEIAELLIDYCKYHHISLEPDQEKYFVDYLMYNIYGFNGIEEFLSDHQIEEIAVIGIDKPVYVYHTERGWLETNLKFRSEETVIAVINKIARQVGRRITYQNPKINAVLPDGSRLHASIPPISNVEITIRKFRSNPVTPVELFEKNIYSKDAIAFLSLVFQSDFNILIAGNTASGKTTTLNALFSFVPLSDRILVIEETPEINIPHPHKIKLLSNPELKISMKNLVEDSLRMRPDRVVVGEIRTEEETESFIETILSGQARGSYATFHAQSSDEVIKRMLNLGVSAYDVASIDFIIIQRRLMRYDSNTRRYWEERKGIEISETSREGGVNKLFSLDMKSGNFSGDPSKSNKYEDIASSFGMTKKELNEEIDFRKGILSSIKYNSYNEFVFKLQEKLFSNINLKDIIHKKEADESKVNR
ncbi:MAG: ATPase, T2SS/T4P/T4SS family [Candidatus Micrarchaeota archaeon]|nr:ATPase, T2SS/T4P/T4SS family [Candidatus Micrarchaeota archaeon]